MIVKSMIATCAAVLMVVALSGCSEPSQSVEYRDGRYAGKPDTPAWDSAQFDNSRQVWLKALDRRARLQSEYTRPGGA
jgi:outer membrane protein assembly factor BamE (lipoprotein component of BamABCDE complex)